MAHSILTVQVGEGCEGAQCLPRVLSVRLRSQGSVSCFKATRCQMLMGCRLQPLVSTSTKLSGRDQNSLCRSAGVDVSVSCPAYSLSAVRCVSCCRAMQRSLSRKPACPYALSAAIKIQLQLPQLVAPRQGPGKAGRGAHAHRWHLQPLQAQAT
jgi:hypothetical protein